ncbi:unnamed protein product [Bursaphelenchus okinawaensis]|uniref:Uncharacterized protein n=1 Tax=Bursaphelenchus okinawaensis TaxID=465554 RepID=A0A811KIP8_9BILA|nr:unnamed protein product [Bursaphelenchus okinawaensis]CAG9103723.1 unnamed protein product [Bursaphelenchus okinawaensis]
MLVHSTASASSYLFWSTEVATTQCKVIVSQVTHKTQKGTFFIDKAEFASDARCQSQPDLCPRNPQVPVSKERDRSPIGENNGGTRETAKAQGEYNKSEKVGKHGRDRPISDAVGYVGEKRLGREPPNPFTRGAFCLDILLL